VEPILAALDLVERRSSRDCHYLASNRAGSTLQYLDMAPDDL
ncbi:MAG: hypothetical protein AVDCRST_MAG93-968, partial [uncultured Chloroflexia bacterium]